MGNENSDAGHIKCLRGPQVPHPWCTASIPLPTHTNIHDFKPLTTSLVRVDPRGRLGRLPP